MKNSPLNFFRHWKKHGFKKTCKDLKYNYVMLETPEQMLRKEIIGYVGSMFGAAFAATIFTVKGSWYLLPLFSFSILIMYANFKRCLKQLQMFRNAKECLDENLPGEKE